MKIPFKIIMVKIKTYFIDIDGTIFPHMTAEELDDVYKTNHETHILPGVEEYWETFNEDDVIIISTARPGKYRHYTERNLRLYNLRFDYLLMDIGTGPRILINDVTDKEPIKAIAYNIPRDGGLKHLINRQLPSRDPHDN